MVEGHGLPEEVELGEAPIKLASFRKDVFLVRLADAGEGGRLDPDQGEVVGEEAGESVFAMGIIEPEFLGGSRHRPFGPEARGGGRAHQFELESWP